MSQEDKKKRERVLETLATFKEAFNQIINSKDSSIPLGVILKSKLMLIELDNINPKENKLFDSTSQANKLGDQFIALINQSGKIQ